LISGSLVEKESFVSLVAGRQVSSEPPGVPPTAPTQTLLRFDQHKTPTDLTFHGGAIAPALPIQLLFWGEFWRSLGAQQRSDIEARAQELLAGPYTSALDQYGITRPFYRGSLIVLSPAPPTDPFDGGDINSMIWDLINTGVFPEPDEPGGRNGYFVMMPPATSMKNPGGGAHTSRFHYEFPADVDWVWAGWSNYNQSVDTMTATFSHELVELLTDPEMDGWYNDTLDHNEGEIADLCQPGGNWETAFVGDVNVMAYWSARDQACVIPTHTLRVRVDGLISVDDTRPDGEGDQEYPFGQNRPLCALLPACCFKGPYHWRRTQVLETATLEATTSGYHAPTLVWAVNDQNVSGQGKISVSVDVTRDTPTGPVTANETFDLSYAVADKYVQLGNDSVVGNFDIVVSATSDEPTSPAGATGGSRTAAVVVPFRGSEFTWDDGFQRDQEACRKESDALWVATHKATEEHPGPIDPGPLRQEDRAIMASLGAWVSEDAWRAARMTLAHAASIEAKEPEAAAGLRRSLLGSLGVAPTDGEDVHNRDVR
jgi:hypothetical protein